MEQKAGIAMQFLLMIAILTMWGLEFFVQGMSNAYLQGVITGVFVGVGGFTALRNAIEFDSKDKNDV